MERRTQEADAADPGGRGTADARSGATDEFGWRNYAHDGQITLSEIHRFSEDGSVSVARSNATTDTEMTWEEKLEDTAVLLEAIPEFGDYESITRFERVHGDVAGSPDPFSGRI